MTGQSSRHKWGDNQASMGDARRFQITTSALFCPILAAVFWRLLPILDLLWNKLQVPGSGLPEDHAALSTEGSSAQEGSQHLESSWFLLLLDL